MCCTPTCPPRRRPRLPTKQHHCPTARPARARLACRETQHQHSLLSCLSRSLCSITIGPRWRQDRRLKRGRWPPSTTWPPTRPSTPTIPNRESRSCYTSPASPAPEVPQTILPNSGRFSNSAPQMSSSRHSSPMSRTSRLKMSPTRSTTSTSTSPPTSSSTPHPEPAARPRDARLRGNLYPQLPGPPDRRIPRQSALQLPDSPLSRCPSPTLMRRRILAQ